MRRSLIAAVLLVFAAVCSAPAFAQGPNLVGSMEAHKIVLDKENREIVVSADEVFPRDMIEYTLRYRNDGTDAASGISLIGPVPSGTSYLDETATDTQDFIAQFSIDGGITYHDAPVMYTVINEQGVKVLREATPEMITHIKWFVSKVLEVDREVSVSYRVKVR
jgi:uncharacterized repeat protein (TIGR01451 family)